MVAHKEMTLRLVLLLFTGGNPFVLFIYGSPEPLHCCVTRVYVINDTHSLSIFGRVVVAARLHVPPIARNYDFFELLLCNVITERFDMIGLYALPNLCVWNE